MKLLAVSLATSERCFALVMMTAEEVRTGPLECSTGETFTEADMAAMNKLIEQHTQRELFAEK